MSRISHKYKFIFFSFPKTGSESVRKLLNPYADIKATIFKKINKHNPFYSHITPKETCDIFVKRGWKFDKYFKFVFVRNPYARTVSLYNMIAKDKDFKEWLKTLKNNGDGGSENPNHKWKVYGAYSIINYITDDDGNILVDKVFKLENIDKEFPTFMKNQFGIKVKIIPKINQGSYKKKYQSYYDEESKKIVEELYHYEFENFGYTF